MRLKSGKLLRGLMDSRNMSNAAVAQRAGVGRTFISALVVERRSSCTPEVAAKIAECLGVPVDLLFAPRTSADNGRNNKNGVAV